jgi:hypothetical protein
MSVMTMQCADCEVGTELFILLGDLYEVQTEPIVWMLCLPVCNLKPGPKLLKRFC